ncbi:MAG: 50S ribosomal protein P1 [bacterium]|nr:50S ribosomal protein P1 [bacterium]
MEYVYASLLLFRAKKEINEANVKKVLEAAGVKVDDGRVKALVAALDGVNIEQAIKEAVVPMAAAPVAHGHAPEAKKEEKKEEKKSAEESVAGLGSLFG